MRINKSILPVLTAVILGVFGMLSFKVRFCGNVFGRPEMNYISDLTIYDILAFAGISLAVFIIIRIATIYSDRIKYVLFTTKERGKPFKIWLISFVVLTVLWSPHLLSFIPGHIPGDAFSSLEQNLTGVYNNYHPIMYTLLIGLFIKLGLLLKNSISWGFLLYTLTQYCVMSATMAGIVAAMYKKQVRTWFIILTLSFFSLFPIFPSIAITAWKDPLFSLALLAFSVVLVQKDSSNWQAFLAALWVLFARNNGIVSVLPVAAIFLCSKRMENRTKALAISLSVLIYLAVVGPVLKPLNINSSKVEVLGMPIQQIAGTVYYESESLTDDEIAIIEKMMPIEDFIANYSPCIVNSTKWAEHFNPAYVESNSREVIKLWLELMPKHLKSFSKAYWMETLGYWHAWLSNDYNYYFNEIELNEFVSEYDAIKKISGVSLQSFLREFKPMIGSGSLAWIMLASFAICSCTRKRHYLMFYLPSLFCWIGVMLSPPAAFCSRYVFILILMLPLFIVFPFMTGKE